MNWIVRLHPHGCGRIGLQKLRGYLQLLRPVSDTPKSIILALWVFLKISSMSLYEPNVLPSADAQQRQMWWGGSSHADFWRNCSLCISGKQFGQMLSPFTRHLWKTLLQIWPSKAWRRHWPGASRFPFLYLSPSQREALHSFPQTNLHLGHDSHRVTHTASNACCVSLFSQRHLH